MSTITNVKKFCKNHSTEIGAAVASAGISAGLIAIGYQAGSFNTLAKNLNDISAGKQMAALTSSAMMMEDGASFLWQNASTGEPVQFILKQVK